MTTKSIRRPLPKDITNNEKGVFGPKYLCIASITKMADHRGVYFFESHASSDHSLGTNQERYLEQKVLALTL